MEVEGLCTAVVEVVSHIDGSAQQDQQQDYAHTHARLVGHMHLPNQLDKRINTITLLQGRPYMGDMTHLGRRQRGLKWALKAMNEAIGSQDVGIGDKAVVNVPG